jgi:acyl dehydratase
MSSTTLEVTMPDESQIGMELDEVTMPVERGKVLEFVRSLHDGDPAYRDEEAAKSAGFEAIPAPLTFSVAAMHWRDRDAAIEDLGFDFKRLLHGGTRWEYERPIVVGDELTCRRRVVAVKRREGKRGGSMTFVTVEAEFTDPAGEVVLRQYDTLIETGG